MLGSRKREIERKREREEEKRKESKKEKFTQHVYIAQGIVSNVSRTSKSLSELLGLMWVHTSQLTSSHLLCQHWLTHPALKSSFDHVRYSPTAINAVQMNLTIFTIRHLPVNQRQGLQNEQLWLGLTIVYLSVKVMREATTHERTFAALQSQEVSHNYSSSAQKKKGANLCKSWAWPGCGSGGNLVETLMIFQVHTKFWATRMSLNFLRPIYRKAYKLILLARHGILQWFPYSNWHSGLSEYPPDHDYYLCKSSNRIWSNNNLKLAYKKMELVRTCTEIILFQ